MTLVRRGVLGGGTCKTVGGGKGVEWLNKKALLKLFDCPNSIQDQLINAGVMAGFNFFGTLVGIGATGIRTEPFTCIVASGISAGFAFFGSLVAQRGLQKKE